MDGGWFSAYFRAVGCLAAAAGIAIGLVIAAASGCLLSFLW